MISDIRQAWRMIRRMPGLASVVIVSLGIGIGVNTAVFSWIQAMVLQPIPGVVDAGGVQLVEPRADTGSYPGASWLEYRDLRDRMRTLPDLFAFRMVPFNVGDSGRPERIHGLLPGPQPQPFRGGGRRLISHAAILRRLGESRPASTAAASVKIRPSDP